MDHVPQQTAHGDRVIRLPDVPAVDDALGASVERAARRLQNDLWIRRAYAAEHEDRHRAPLDHLAHSLRIAGVSRLDGVGAELRGYAGAEREQLRVALVLDTGAPQHRFDDDGDRGELTGYWSPPGAHCWRTSRPPQCRRSGT